MIRPADPRNEQPRLAALHDLAILDTPADPGFDRLTALACDVLEVPIAVVSLVDARRQWFKSHTGLDVSETPRDVSFCAHAVASGSALVVEDARLDERFHDNPAVTGPPHVRFYAGQLLRPDGRHAVGTLCVMDHRPRTLSPQGFGRLAQLAAQAEELLREHQLRVQLVEQKRVLAGITQRLTALLQAMPDALYLLDAAGRVTRLDTEEAVSDAFVEALGQRLAGHQGVGAPPSFVWEAGDERTYEVRVVPANGEHLAIARDITERHQVERMKAEFVSTVSHELRTPLTAICGALGMLASGMGGTLPEDAGALVAVADKNGARLTRLIDDILDMEKLEAGQLIMHPQVVSLGALVEQALHDNAPYAESFSVDLALVPPLPAEDAVSVEPDRFAQVMANLLSNAIKHSAPGSVVRVEVVPRPRDGQDGLEVAVSDRGQGIPLAFQPRVFERFAQADGSDRRRTGGTGLGLAITRRLVTLMQGDIGFTSVPGEGSCFWVWLPRAAAPCPSSASMHVSTINEERP